MAGTVLRTLQGEDQAIVSRECRLDRLGAMPGHHHNAVWLQAPSVIQHVLQHGFARDAVQHLGKVGLHALPQSGGEYDDVQHIAWASSLRFRHLIGKYVARVSGQDADLRPALRAVADLLALLRAVPALAAVFLAAVFLAEDAPADCPPGLSPALPLLLSLAFWSASALSALAAVAAASVWNCCCIRFHQPCAAEAAAPRMSACSPAAPGAVVVDLVSLPAALPPGAEPAPPAEDSAAPAADEAAGSGAGVDAAPGDVARVEGSSCFVPERCVEAGAAAFAAVAMDAMPVSINDFNVARVARWTSRPWIVLLSMARFMRSQFSTARRSAIRLSISSTDITGPIVDDASKPPE